MTERYPDRPVRVLVPFPPGGSTDFAAKTVAPHLATTLGQPFVVESVVGDRGIAALRALADADPHTVMVGSVNTNAITPVFFPSRIPFDYRQTITPVSRLSEFPSLLVVSASAPATTLPDFLEHAKRIGGAVRNGTDWLGSYPDIDGLRLARAAGIDVLNVERPGGADGLLAAVLAGEIDMLFLNVRTAGDAMRAGRIKALAVAGPTRLDGLPNVPTLGECGFEGIGTRHWQGLFVSSRASAPLVRLLHRAVVQALSSDDTRGAFESAGARATPSASPEQFAAELDAERERWEAVRATIRGGRRDLDWSPGG